MRKKKGGKGLSVLSGCDLFGYKKDLFKDCDDYEDDGLSDNEDANTKQTLQLLPAISKNTNGHVQDITKQINSELFLQGNDEDLDNLEDD